MAEVILQCRGAAQDDDWAYDDDPNPSSDAKALVVELRKVVELQSVVAPMGRLTVTVVRD